MPRFLVIAVFVSVLATIAFVINSAIDVVMLSERTGAVVVSESEVTFSQDALNAISGWGRMDVQVLLDAALILLAAFIGDRFVRAYYDTRDFLGLRSVFRRRLMVTLLVVFTVVQAGSFCVITTTTKEAAARSMGATMEQVGTLVRLNDEHTQEVLDVPEFNSLTTQTKDTLLYYDPSLWLVSGYNSSDEKLYVFKDDVLGYSNDPDPVGATIEECYGAQGKAMLDDLAKTGEMRSMVYGTHVLTEASEAEVEVETQGEEGDAQEDMLYQLGFMRALKDDAYTIVMARPASHVFASRSVTMRWATVLAFALMAAVYVVVARNLIKVVVEPLERTNESLAKITEGNLDELVKETETLEFAVFSAGINATVDTLKGLIDEAERRMEHDLATAKAIQESALPRTFPPFPEISAFDIYASMDAAKEVGGDFYDFFLIDNKTLGFLIADVSGKGIPGALFMMAAKTEIENYLSTGMPPAEAIASANRRLCASNDAGMFVTVWAATFDWETGLLTYVNAGHNFPLLRHGSGGTWEWLKKKCGLFLGTFETAKYRQETIMLEQGDELLLYTDGVNEAFSASEEEFGNERLEAFLASHTYLGPKMLVQRLRAEVAGWAEGAEQSDDITILALEYGAVPEASASLTLPATLDSLGEAMRLVSGELERRLCPVSVLRKVEVSLEELFVNVCRYAYADADEPGEVTVSYVYTGSPRSITVELRDTGVPFDPVSRTDPTKPTSIHNATIGGLGIFMVKQSMDDFAYARDGDANVVTFRKSW